MGKTPLFLAASVCSLSANAAFYGPVSSFGPDVASTIRGDARNAILEANSNPTLTRSVSFVPFGGALSNDVEWTWRINASDMAAPDAESDSGDKPADPHVVSMTYDFSWPGNSANISSALNGASGQFCFMSLGDRVDLPVNVTNAYTDDSPDSTGTSCEPMLGKQCVDAILNQAPLPGRGGDCGFPEELWNTLPECQGVFGVASAYSQRFNGIWLTGNRTTAWMSGDGFFGNVSEPLEGSGSRIFNSNANRLHVLWIKVGLTEDGSDGTSPVSDLLCMRVNATALPDVDVDGDGVAYTSEVVQQAGKSGAATLGQREGLCTAIFASFVGLLAIL